MHETLSLIVHGESGTGKSWLADTAPAPRLILDAEGGSKFTASRKTYWDGRSAPPAYDGSWDTCVVITRDFRTVSTVHQWLNSGQHQFRSVVLDSLTEIQKRCLDDVAGVDQPTQQDWGALLRQMEGLVRQFRDLTIHPVTPLEAVVFVAMTHLRDGRFKPLLQGALRDSLPYFVDVVGYLYVQNDPATGDLGHRLLVQPTGQFEAKDRTNRLGHSVPIEDLNGYDGQARVGIARLIDQVYGRADGAAAPGVGQAPPQQPAATQVAVHQQAQS